MKHTKKIIIYVSLFIVLVVAINILMNALLVNTKKSEDKIKAASNIYISLTQPDITLLSFGKSKSPVFGSASMDYIASDYYLLGNKIEGKLSSSFGKLKADEAVAINYVTYQYTYLNTRRKDNVDILRNAGEDVLFKVTFGCNDIEYNRFIQQLRKTYSFDALKDAMINYIAIRSSEDNQEVAIGIPGPISSVIADVVPSSEIKRADMYDAMGQRTYLMNCLKYLEAEKSIVAKLANSGLFEQLDIDYLERAKYISLSDFNVMGFSGYMTKREINKIINENIFIVDIELI